MTPEALTVAMALVPEAYSRNRFFSFFEKREFKRARARAKLLRSIANELGEHPEDAQSVELRDGPTHSILFYIISSMKVSRQVSLFGLERSLLMVLLERRHIKGVAASADDRNRVREALALLLPGKLLENRVLGELA